MFRFSMPTSAGEAISITIRPPGPTIDDVSRVPGTLRSPCNLIGWRRSAVNRQAFQADGIFVLKRDDEIAAACIGRHGIAGR